MATKAKKLCLRVGGAALDDLPKLGENRRRVRGLGFRALLVVALAFLIAVIPSPVQSQVNTSAWSFVQQEEPQDTFTINKDNNPNPFKTTEKVFGLVEISRSGGGDLAWKYLSKGSMPASEKVHTLAFEVDGVKVKRVSVFAGPVPPPGTTIFDTGTPGEPDDKPEKFKGGLQWFLVIVVEEGCKLEDLEKTQLLMSGVHTVAHNESGGAIRTYKLKNKPMLDGKESRPMVYAIKENVRGTGDFPNNSDFRPNTTLGYPGAGETLHYTVEAGEPKRDAFMRVEEFNTIISCKKTVEGKAKDIRLVQVRWGMRLGIIIGKDHKDTTYGVEASSFSIAHGTDINLDLNSNGKDDIEEAKANGDVLSGASIFSHYELQP